MFKRVLVTLFALAPSLFLGAPAIHADGVNCTFSMGFATIASLIPDQVGGCLTSPFGLGTGDVVQQTTEGQLTWDKASNVSRFVDGATNVTWVLGPFGLQSRPGDQRLAWESPQSLVAGVSINKQAPPSTTSCLEQLINFLHIDHPVSVSVTFPTSPTLFQTVVC